VTIPRLEDLSIAQRIVLTVAIVLIVLFCVAAAGFFGGGWEAEGAAESPRWTPSKWDDHIDALERAAIDDAFKKHIMTLYSVWVTDNYQPKIPPKALTGAHNARDAYIRSMEAIETREAERKKGRTP
jgi:hypothetical protein